MRYRIRARANCVVLAFCSIGGTWAVPSSVFAQNDSDRATARALAEEGYNALKAQKYDIAEDRFRRADALVHAPTLVVDDGRALMGLGRYLDAQEKFELVLREGVAENAPAVWKAAVVEAAKLLEEVRPKVAWLTIMVPNVQHPHVSIGGRSISEAAIGVKFALNPGAQTVEVTAEGYETKAQSLNLDEGSEQTLEVTLTQLPRQGQATNVGANVPQKHSDDSDSGQRTAAYITLGAGAAGLVVGSITGILALKKRSDLTSVCVNGQCPRSSESSLNSYHSLGLVSGIGFGVGLAGAAVGFLLYGTSGNSGEHKQAVSNELQLQFGPSSLRLQGTF